MPHHKTENYNKIRLDIIQLKSASIQYRERKPHAAKKKILGNKSTVNGIDAAYTPFEFLALQ